MYADRLEGEVVAEIFRAADGGWAVLRVRAADGQEHACVGMVGHLHVGQRLSATGAWSTDPRHGPRFKVDSVLVDDPRTLGGLERYLAATVEGLGEELARRVVHRFGLDTLAVLDEHPERLLEVTGIGARLQDRIAASWSATRLHRDVEIALRGHGVPPSAVRRVLERFGRDAPSVVAREPYRLVEVRGIGFRTADAVARAQGIEASAPARVDAAIGYCLSEAAGQGSCYLPAGILHRRLEALEIPAPAASEGIDRQVAAGALVRHPAPLEADAPVFTAEMEAAEAAVARALRARVGRFPAKVDVEEAARAVRLALNPEQEAAIRMACAHSVAIVTGGPGTGKTTIVRALVAAVSARGERWRLASPTGRAARRLQSAAGIPATTLHRLLEMDPRTGEFQRGPAHPLDGDGLLVDEASMLDLPLLRAVLDAMPAGMRLVLVGDVDQLPSVGPGQVLRDLIDAGTLPVTRLGVVYRQAEDSSIVRNAHRVNRGELPVSSERDGEVRRDYFHVEREDAAEAQATIRQVVCQRLPALGFDPVRDVQVLTPMHAGPLGTIALNEVLQSALHSGESDAPRAGPGGFRVGDRVIFSKNDAALDVSNGDVGRVVDLAAAGAEVEVEGRRVRVEGAALEQLDLAYAISVHKSQGSEYPAVVLALHPSHFVLLRRNLVYTAITRARKFCCIVGPTRALRLALGRAGGEQRYTLLARRL